MMDGVGHIPYEEMPEEFNRIVLEFLSRDTPPISSRHELQAAIAYATPLARHA
jgi:hypothetical protein